MEVQIVVGELHFMPVLQGNKAIFVACTDWLINRGHWNTDFNEQYFKDRRELGLLEHHAAGDEGEISEAIVDEWIKRVQDTGAVAELDGEWGRFVIQTEGWEEATK